MAELNAVQENLIGRSSRYIVSGMEPADLDRIIPTAQTWEDWRRNVSQFAAERRRLAEEARANGHLVTACEHLVSAAIYYHFAQLGYFEDTAKKRATAALARENHRLAFDLLDPPVEQLRIPFRETQLLGNLRLPRRDEPLPVVILLPGADSTKEEMITFESVFHKRGLATLAFEGPGQGEVGETLPLIEDYESAVSALLDSLEFIPGVDSRRVGLYGRSLGGFLAPRVAALEPRIAAVTSAGGFYDFSAWPKYSQQLKQFFCHCWGYASLADGEARARRSTLAGLLEKISCPFLVLHSGGDPFFSADDARRIAAETRCEVTLKIYPEGNHVCDNIPYKYRPFVADWFVDRLAAGAGVKKECTGEARCGRHL